MLVSNFKTNCAKTISSNLNGRKVICYGDVDREFENYLGEMDIKIDFCVLRNKALCDGVKLFDASILNGMSSEYYVICFTSTNSDKDTAWIREYGFQQGRDYMFMASPVTVVPKGSLNWYDKNGNTCSYCPENCKITFAGNNSEVDISINVKIKKQLNIRLGDDCKVVIADKVNIKEGTWFLNGDCISVNIANNVSISDSNIIMYSHSQLDVGEDTSIFEIMIRAFQNTQIITGTDCMISQNVILYAGDGHAIFDVEKEERLNNPFDQINDENHYAIKLGNHVWVGMAATLLNGTEVKTGSIIGMGSIVKGKFPNNCSIAGNPAKIIKKNVAWSRSIMDMNIDSCGEEYVRKTDMNDGEDE